MTDDTLKLNDGTEIPGEVVPVKVQAVPPITPRYLRFKIAAPPREKLTEADIAARMREQVKSYAPKAIEELTRQFEAATSPKKKAKLELRIREWLKLLGYVARDELALLEKAKQNV